MPIDESAGFSEDTAIKQQHFGYVLSTMLKIAQSCMRNHWAHKEFLYFDLNAGPGVAGGHEGSPLIFARAALEMGLPFRAWLFEQDPKAAERLAEEIENLWWDERGEERNPHDWDRHFTIVVGDHNQTVSTVIGHDLRDVRQQAYGLVYADPNGKIDLPLTPMAALANAQKLRRVDQLVNVSATTYKRVRGAGQSEGFLLDDLAGINKSQRWFRRPVGKWEWTMAILTNWASFPDFKKMGFLDARSEQGKLLALALNLSKRERMAHTLPLALGLPTAPMPSTSVIPASSPFGLSSSSAPAASASAAGNVQPPSPIT